MRKIIVLVLAGLLAMSLAAGAAWAKPPETSGNTKMKLKLNAMQQLKAEYRAMLQVGTFAKGGKFKDVKGSHWAYGPIQRMTTLGLFAGYNDGIFGPNKNISQVETIALIMRLNNPNNDNEENDTAEITGYYGIPPWAMSCVKEAARENIINLNRFHSHVQASRLQAFVWLAKVLEANGELDPDDINLEDYSNIPFTDLYIDEEDLRYILALYEEGFIAGMPGGKFNPNSAVTRAQMAVIIQRVLEDHDLDWDDLDDSDYIVDEERFSDLEEVLKEDYEDIEGIDIEDIKLDSGGDEVDVVIEVDLDEYEAEWADLDDSDIEGWIADVVEDIVDELSDDYDDIEVNGKIINNDNDDVLVTFSKNGDDDLEVEFRDDDYRDGDLDVNEVEDELRGVRHDVGDTRFKITYINYNNDEITVDLKAQEKWNGTDIDDFEDDVMAICQIIIKAFEDDAGIKPESISISLLDKNSGLLESYDYDVDELEPLDD